MKKKQISILFALIMFLMISVFAVMYHKSGRLPAKVVGLIAATCLPPMGMLLYTSRKTKQ